MHRITGKSGGDSLIEMSPSDSGEWRQYNRLKMKGVSIKSPFYWEIQISFNILSLYIKITYISFFNLFLSFNSE